MKRIALIVIVCFCLSKTYAQTDSKAAHAKQLLELTGSSKVGIQMINNMIGSLKKSLPTVPAEFWDEFVKGIDAKEMVDILIPIYSKYYSDEEIVKLIEFYKSPLGKKVIERLPLISQDSFTAGQEWGRKLGERAADKLKEKGYL